MSHGPPGLSKEELLKVGKKEAKLVNTKLPLKKRIIAEVKAYNEEYGIASRADVVTELNSRGKDLVFQGELDTYAEEGEDRIQEVIDELVKEGKLRAVKVPGAKTGYVVPTRGTATVEFRTSRRTRKKYPVRHESKDELDSALPVRAGRESSLWDSDLDDILPSDKEEEDQEE